MRALTVEPGRPGSVRVEEVRDVHAADDELLVRGVALGICGTDKEIVGGNYGWPVPGEQRLILGHESLGRVVRSPADSDFAPGDLIAGVVRRPDPAPCGACAHDEWDMCRNGRYTERGIKQIHGYGSEQWTVPARFAVQVDSALGTAGVLTEPTSVVAKAWEQIDRIGHRAWFEPERALITGAGPIGLLAAMIGVQRGLEVHVLDRVTDGPKPDLVRELGATYHTGEVADIAERHRPNVVIEATGVGQLVFDAMAQTATYGIACLTGVSAAGRRLGVDAGALNREIVLENDVVVGSVNANLRHYREAARALALADRTWLDRLLSPVPLDRAVEVFEGEVAAAVKTVLMLEET